MRRYNKYGNTGTYETMTVPSFVMTNWNQGQKYITVLHQVATTNPLDAPGLSQFPPWYTPGYFKYAIIKTMDMSYVMDIPNRYMTMFMVSNTANGYSTVSGTTTTLMSYQGINAGGSIAKFKKFRLVIAMDNLGGQFGIAIKKDSLGNGAISISAPPWSSSGQFTNTSTNCNWYTYPSQTFTLNNSFGDWTINTCTNIWTGALGEGYIDFVLTSNPIDDTHVRVTLEICRPSGNGSLVFFDATGLYNHFSAVGVINGYSSPANVKCLTYSRYKNLDLI
jgi:hypothetical protein